MPDIHNTFEPYWDHLIQNNTLKRINKNILPEYKRIINVLWDHKKNKLKASDIEYILRNESKIIIDLEIITRRLATLKKKEIVEVANKKITYIINELADIPCYGNNIAILFNDYTAKLIADSIDRLAIRKIIVDKLDLYKTLNEYPAEELRDLIVAIKNISSLEEVDPIMDVLNHDIGTKGIFNLYGDVFNAILDADLYEPQHGYGKLRWINGANQYKLLIP